MQVFVLLLMIALLTARQADVAPPYDAWWLWLVVNLPYAGLALLAAATAMVGHRAMRRRPGNAPFVLRSVDRVFTMARFATLGLFFIHLFALGYLGWLHDRIHVWLLLNELVALTPPLGVIIITWWAYYPIDRELRQASLIRQLDDGQRIWPILTRAQYLINQIRHQLLLMLVPLLTLLAWSQLVDQLVATGYLPTAISGGLLAVGGMGVFVLSPLIIRYLWDTQPMPDGEIRHMLLELCQRHQVKVRELLLWRTYGGLINGAVMGLVSPLRYILLTDGLLDQLPPKHVEAVMAHELGHVRRRHMPWMIACAIGLLMGVMAMMDLVASGIFALIEQVSADALSPWVTDGQFTGSADELFGSGLMLIGMIVWMPAFGFLSRRIERQADTFAVQHLTQNDAAQRIITVEAADTMAGALANVARLNNVAPTRRSWRHGSIQWRIDYLRSLAGTPVDQCAVDRLLPRLRWGCIALGLAAVMLWTVG